MQNKVNKSYIAIGSNLGDRLKNCNHAVQRIDALTGCRVVKRSPWFRTSPVGMDTDEWFINGVAEIDTDLSPRELLHSLLQIEKSMGRVRKKKWESRIIDLDILLYGNSIIHDPELKIPHPLMHERRFVLVPMESIAPDLIHPVLGTSIKEMLNNLGNNDERVFMLEESL